MKLESSAVFLIRTNSKSVTLHRKLHGFKTERSGGGQSPAFEGGPAASEPGASFAARKPERGEREGRSGLK